VLLAQSPELRVFRIIRIVQDGEMRITTAEFIKQYGELADRAISEPLTVTKNGRDRLVLLSVAEYARLLECARHPGVRPADEVGAESKS